ncbi:leucine-rich repeat domain-containing protein [Ruminococcus sp. NK3A76]|uniref:leucine-rich repeat domain-containing protein n=1 Tax=Ruminococcus sp. NK3A76 TaxID=877411 RepID=UPI00056A9455|nr:leucine-rich repeat domain-containing protein [Ruminococcus sp. NK3A76]
MKKRILALVTALGLALNGAAMLPEGTVELGLQIEARAETYRDYEYTLLDDGTVEISKYNENDTEVIIPETIDGKKVTSIGYYAFADCSVIKKITIPYGVTTIGSYAFYGCYDLISIVIPESVSVIDSSAFYWCVNLSDITIPNSVKSIGMYAFEHCESLTSIQIPESVTSIGYAAFRNCESLNSITIPDKAAGINAYTFDECNNLENIEISDDNIYYSYIDGIIYNKDIHEVLYCPCTNSISNVVIPDSVTSINANAFCGCKGLVSVKIPNSVTQIKENAFKDCVDLKGVTIPNSVTYIGWSAFYGCKSLTSVSLSNSITMINYELFRECTSLKEITIPEGVTIVKDLAFCNCNNLVNVKLPDSLTKIDYEAFYNTSISSISIPNNVNSIGSYVFWNCDKLKSIHLNDDNPNFVMADGILYSKDKTKLYYSPEGNDIKSIIIPDGVTRIEDGAFTNSKNLASVKIPKSVISIGNAAFGNTAITNKQEGFIKNVDNWIVEYDRDIYNLYDNDNDNKDSIIIPEGIIGICDYCFKDTDIKKAELPKSLRIIGKSAFGDCRFLESIHIPEGVIRIGEDAFSNYGSRENIDGLLYLDNWLVDSGKLDYNVEIRSGTVGIADNSIDGRISRKTIIPDSVVYLWDIYEKDYDDGSYASQELLCHNNTDAYKYAISAGFIDTGVTEEGYAVLNITGVYEYEDSDEEADDSDDESEKNDEYNEDDEEAVEDDDEDYSPDDPGDQEEHEHIFNRSSIVPATCTTEGYTENECGECGYIERKTISPANGHKFGEWKKTTPSTCTYEGTETRNCSVCGKTETRTIAKTSHSYTSKITTVATCTKDGVKTYTCKCGDSYTEAIKATGHKYTEKVVKPTYTAQGYTLHTCSVCGDSYKDNVKAKLTRTSIAKAKITGLSDKTYTGKAITQKPVVKLGSKTLKSGTDYTVTYKNNKAIGTATVTISGKGAYTGTTKATFKINPKKTTLKTVTSPKTKRLKATYSKVSGVTGYQITYSTSSKFTKATTKSVNVKGTSKTISKLTKGKTYYVKVRTYKTVGKTKYYSGYSAVKKIKVK